MRIGIICASDTELAPFLAIMHENKTTQKAMLTFHEGTIVDTQVVALFSGVCKVNAAIAAQVLIDTYHVDAIINAGTAGGMNDELEIFDTVISSHAAYHDVAPDILTQFHPWMETASFQADQTLIQLSRKAVARFPWQGRVYWGLMVTGETFITDAGRREINDQFAPLSVDMETASIAHVCYANGIPFLAIRTITDTATRSGADYFEENCERASAIARDVTVALLSEMHCP